MERVSRSNAVGTKYQDLSYLTQGAVAMEKPRSTAPRSRA
jgi:hypothetical protein